MNLSDDHTSSPENASQRQLPLFLLPNSTYGQGTISQACNAPLPNGNVSEVIISPVKARRKMIDLQLPAHQYLDDTDEITTFAPYKRSKSGRGGDASRRSNSSGSCLDVKCSTGLLADLNEPLLWQDLEPVPLSRDAHSHHGRHNADVQGQWVQKNTSQNGCMVFGTGYMEARSVNPQASYDSYYVASSNAPGLHNDYRPDFVRPWSHRSSSWGNHTHQRPCPVQTNPFMNFVTHARADSSSETRSHVASKGIHHGFSSGQSFENPQGAKKQECSARLPWLKPKPTYKSEVSNGFLDLNASADEAGDGLSSVCPQKSLRSSASCSNNADTGRVQKHTSLLSQHKEVNHLLKRDFDINLPCDDAETYCVKEEEGNKAANVRHYFDLNSCASCEDDEVSGLRVKRKGTFQIDFEALPTLETEEEQEEDDGESLHERLMGNSLDELIKLAAQSLVAISLSDHPDDAASSSTDAASKSPLSWFADIITSCNDELVGVVDTSPEEYSSGEIDYFEAMTLSLHPTKEEDYMPEPLVPANLISKETGLNRPRRGQARRGRPKRDFQRDTLPGLYSLSRQEVTEDIQLFGALMKSRECTSGSSCSTKLKRKKKNGH